MGIKFVVKLRQTHLASGLSKYRVSKDTGIAMNTVVKYVDVDAVEVGQLPNAVLQLIRYYGVDWRDPNIIEVVDDQEAEEEKQNALLAST